MWFERVFFYIIILYSEWICFSLAVNVDQLNDSCKIMSFLHYFHIIILCYLTYLFLSVTSYYFKIIWKSIFKEEENCWWLVKCEYVCTNNELLLVLPEVCSAISLLIIFFQSIGWCEYWCWLWIKILCICGSVCLKKSDSYYAMSLYDHMNNS